MSILRMVTYRQADILTFNVFLQDPPETRIYANYLVIQYIWSRCSLRAFYQRYHYKYGSPLSEASLPAE